MAQGSAAAFKLFYEESSAANNKVVDALDGYRTNAGKVLALGTAAATFFGFEDSVKGPFFYGALGAFFLATLLALWIYVPVGMSVNVAADAEVAFSGTWPDGRTRGPITGPKLHFDLALLHQEAFRTNLARIAGPFGLAARLQALIACVAAVVILGGINVAQEQPVVPDEPQRIIIVEEP